MITAGVTVGVGMGGMPPGMGGMGPGGMMPPTGQPPIASMSFPPQQQPGGGFFGQF